MAISIGLKTRTHVFICSETVFSESIMKIKEDEENTTVVDDVIVNVTGKQGDALRLMAYAIEASKLLALQYRIKLEPALISDTIRQRIHSGLRSKPLSCSAIVGGIGSEGLELRGIDSYGTVHADNFVVTGYGLYFLYGLYDAYYSEDMGEGEAMHFLRLCIKTLKEKMILETERWSLDVIYQDGAKQKLVFGQQE